MGTSVTIARSLFPTPASQLSSRAVAPDCSSEAAFRHLVATRSWADVARICGTTVALAQARARPVAKQVAVLAKPRPVYKPPVRPQRRTPEVMPIGSTTSGFLALFNQQCKDEGVLDWSKCGQERFAASRTAAAPLPFRSQAMPLHRPFIESLASQLPCFPPTHRDPVSGQCILGTQVGPDSPMGIPSGGTVMGRYGAAYFPGKREIQRSICLSGDLVGDDGLCYSRKTITNKERKWPRGRQPLLTGGEMKAISIATRAAGKFERTQKRLQKLGMIKKPSSGRARAPMKALPPPHHTH